MNNIDFKDLSARISNPQSLTCPFCFNQLKEPMQINSIKTKRSYYMNCSICGKIQLDSSLKNSISNALSSKHQGYIDDDSFKDDTLEYHKLLFNHLYIVASYFYERKNKDEFIPIDKDRFIKIIKKIDLPITLLQKRDKLLLNIYDITEYFGKTVEIDKNGAYLCYAKNTTEYLSILEHCIDDKLFKKTDNSLLQNLYLEKETKFFEIKWTQKGYSKIEDIIKKQKTKITNNAFVVMKLDGEKGKYQTFYESNIIPAIKEAGYNPLPIIEKSTNESLITEIMNEIRKSAFVVVIMADHYPELNRDDVKNKKVHDSNYNIYWEAGFAKGCNKEVFLLYPESVYNEVHIPFDLSGFRHYPYDDSVNQIYIKQEKFVRLLSSSIVDILGTGKAKY